MSEMMVYHRVITVFVLLALCGCSDESNSTTPSGDVFSLTVAPDTYLIAGIGNTVSLSAKAFDGSGRPIVTPIAWSSCDQEILTVNGNGVTTGNKAGVSCVLAKAGGKEFSAKIEVWDPPSLDTYTSGQIYQGRNGYAEYIPGDLPLILSAPHGGDICSNEIPDRTYGSIGRCSSTGSDTNTYPLTTTIRSVFLENTGHTPHIILLRLARPKLDANREIGEAAQGNSFAENAWSEYHGFIDAAKDTVSKEFGFGLYMDMHGHGHDIPRVELGYLLSKTDLQTSILDLHYMTNKSSFKRLSGISVASSPASTTFTDIIRGPKSLGTLLEERGTRAVPSGPDPTPVGDEKFFSGGYSTSRHGSKLGGVIDGVQFEHHYPGLRDTSNNRLSYAQDLVEILEIFLEAHYGWSISSQFFAN